MKSIKSIFFTLLFILSALFQLSAQPYYDDYFELTNDPSFSTYNMTSTSNGGAVFSGTISDDAHKLFVAKTQEDGAVDWFRKYNFPGSNLIDWEPISILETQEDGFLLGGNATETGSYKNVIFLLSLGNDGVPNWFCYYDCSYFKNNAFEQEDCEDYSLIDLTLDNEGNIVGIGYTLPHANDKSWAFIFKASQDGTVTDAVSYGVGNIENQEHGESIRAVSGGYYASLSNSHTDPYTGIISHKTIVMKLDQQLNEIWSRIYDDQTGIGQDNSPLEMVVNSKNQGVVLTHNPTEATISLLGFDHNGNHRWNNTIDTLPDTYLSNCNYMDIDEADNLYISTYTDQIGIIKTGNKGIPIWYTTYPISFDGGVTDISWTRTSSGNALGVYGNKDFISESTIDYRIWSSRVSTSDGDNNCNFTLNNINSRDVMFSSQPIELAKGEYMMETHFQQAQENGLAFDQYRCNEHYASYSGGGFSEDAEPFSLEINGPENQAMPMFSSVAPNPSSGWFSIYLEQINGKNEGEVQVFDQQGQLIMQALLFDFKTEVDFTTMPKGIYWIKVSAANKTENHKVVIQ